MTTTITPRLPDTSLFHRRASDGRRRVLVVDDDAVARRLMVTVLAVRGYEVLEACGGVEAVDIIARLATERLSLDCMLLDVRMPGLDGMGVLERLTEAGTPVPTVAVSASSDRDTVIQLMRLGCDEFLDKPVQPEELLARINGFIERSQRSTALRRGREDRLREEKAKLEHESERHRRTAHQLGELSRQVESARTVYQDLIGTPGVIDGLDLVWRNRPLAAMGGDFLGVRATDVGGLVLLADVAGHDLGASLHGVLIKAFFEENCRRGLGGEEFLRLLNRQLVGSGAQRRLVTAQLLDFDLAQGRVTVISAGHPQVVVLHGGDEPAVMPGVGSVLGMSEEVSFIPARLELEPGDRLLLCTDGVVDATRVDGPSGRRQRFGLDGLRAAATGPGLAELVAAAWKAALDHCRGKPSDDMLLVGLEVRQRDTRDYEPQAIPDQGSATVRRSDQHPSIPPAKG